MASFGFEWVVKDCRGSLADRKHCLFGLENYKLINAGDDFSGMASALIWMDKGPDWPAIVAGRYDGTEGEVPMFFKDCRHWILADTARLIVPHIGHTWLRSNGVSAHTGRGDPEGALTAAALIKVLMPLEGKCSIDARDCLAFTSFIRPSAITTFFLDGPEKADFFFMSLVVDEDNAPMDRAKWEPGQIQFDSAHVIAILLHDKMDGVGRVFIPPCVEPAGQEFIRKAFQTSEQYASFCSRIKQAPAIELCISKPKDEAREVGPNGICAWCGKDQRKRTRQ